MSTKHGTPLPNNVVRLRPDLHRLQDPNTQRIQFTQRFHDLAKEGANAPWYSDEVRASWRRTATLAARQLADLGHGVSA